MLVIHLYEKLRDCTFVSHRLKISKQYLEKEVPHVDKLFYMKPFGICIRSFSILVIFVQPIEIKISNKDFPTMFWCFIP